MLSRAKGWSVSAWAATAVLVTGISIPAWADGGVTYTEISTGGASGLVYERAGTPSRQQILRNIEARSPIPRAQFLNVDRPQTPTKPGGAAGTAVFDYDNDGDFDIYVTNGPGRANSLFKNLSKETGALSFVDVGAAAGVGATEQDSTGVCYGDIDNDGDDDLYVVATAMPARLFRNNGRGQFTDITATSGTVGYNRHSVGCSMGDVNNDGLLDIVVGNSYDNWNHRIPIFVGGPHYPGFEHTELYINQGCADDDGDSDSDSHGPHHGQGCEGGPTFTEEAESSGLFVNSNMAGPGLTGAAFTWAIAFVDYDQDGDADILSADDQGPPATQFSEERGWNRLHVNDGGFFTDPTLTNGLAVEGSWMGLSFGDYDCNGQLDFFSTDLGDYVRPGAKSRWFLQNSDRTWTDPGLGANPRDGFGWGTVSFDYDNDGDTDIIYYGGVDFLTSQIATNPGTIFQNTGNCSAQFTYDPALGGRHQYRAVNGVAAGDLNGDGFVDLVSVAESTITPSNIFQFYVPGIRPPSGSPFDAEAGFEPYWIPGPTTFTFVGTISNPGNLSVELNSGGNGNKWVSFWPVGSAGVLDSRDHHYPNAPINRSGIGAIFKFTADGGTTAMSPVDGGSSYASQSSREKIFGLGNASKGTLEVVWPGGFKNKLYDVRAGEELVVPAVPCSFDGVWRNRGEYNGCVQHALDEYREARLITPQQRNRLRASALRAYDEAH